MCVHLQHMNNHRSLPKGILALVFGLFLLSNAELALSQEGSSPEEGLEAATSQAGNENAELKPKKWTVPCEREDGTQGIFQVSSNVPDENSPLDLEANPTNGEMAEKPPAPNLQLEASVEESDDEDPFGSPTLKCGRLLTLLAIFASAEYFGP